MEHEEMDPNKEVIKAEVVEPTALESMERAQVDVQIATAKRYPRSIRVFKHKATELACLDEQTAEACYYRLKRGGKIIEGPSIRLAEIVGSTWGNCSYAARVVEIGRRYVTAQGVCYDMERNIRASVEVQRRITNSEGRRFNDDMIAVTANAACSIALRNAIFKVVPFALVKPIYDQSKSVSLGKDKSHSQRIKDALAYYEGKGATAERVFAAIGRAGPEDVTVDDLITLKGMATAIRDGEMSLEDALRPPGEEKKAGSKVQKADVPPPTNESQDTNADFAVLVEKLSAIDPDAVENVIQNAPDTDAAFAELRKMEANIK